MADFVLPVCHGGLPLGEALRLLRARDDFWRTETGVPIRPRLLVPQFCALVEARRYRVKGRCGSRGAPLTDIPEGTFGHFDFSRAAFDELSEAVPSANGGLRVVTWFGAGLWPAEAAAAVVADPTESPLPVESEFSPAARKLLATYLGGRPLSLTVDKMASEIGFSKSPTERALKELRERGVPGWTEKRKSRRDA
jgi:hypothetical protein